MPEIQMPKLSDTMTEGTLVAWKKKKGDKISAGDVIAEIETDKATMERESPEDGTLTEIYVEEGGKVNVGDKIAIIGGEREEAPKKEEQAAQKEEKPKAEEKKEKKPQRETAKTAAPQKAPAATKPSAPSVKPGEGKRIQLSGMRKGIAERLVQSLGPVPHFYLTIEINAAPLMAAREELKSAGEGADTAKITVNDFVLKAAVQAAVKVPRVNASFDGDAFVQYADVDLGIAVAIEDGLLTPVIRAAQNKSLREISELAKHLANRARNKRMKPEEFQGGSFTVSNLGGMGIDSFSAIINPPQGFILAVGKVTKVQVIDDSDQIVVGQRMSITMSCDHRVVDGALGAEYLKELRHLLENPALLLV